MNLTRCHREARKTQIYGFIESNKTFLALLNSPTEIYQLKAKNVFNFPKVLWRGNPKKTVSGIRHRTRECAKTSLEAYKLYFGFKDCFLAKNFSIGIKVSFKNAAYDFIRL